jgi:hypothetical protein
LNEQANVWCRNCSWVPALPPWLTGSSTAGAREFWSWSTTPPAGGRHAVARELDLLLGWRGMLKSIVSDNGTELTFIAILRRGG